MIKDIDFSGLEIVSAVKNITDMYDEKGVICTITFLKEEDSISHLTGIEELVAKLDLEENKKYIKLSYSYTMVEKEIDTDRPVKVIFTGINKPYKKISRCTEDSTELLQDIKFIDEVFERSPNELKRTYL
ncbi:hypothetical protein BZF66_06655 [Salmonella enterica]|nr:hypothetical protein CPT_Munch_186 [Salmonella phage Munch]EAZ2022976.1 hypothetical protein [Salmonella enterica]ECV9084110.1 hypothetical protein [Salmonella enterica subsp. enterica serovar Infantis]MCP0435789.1 hypothetical protein [Salmonella enterica subsp. enterica serovar Mbandaka]EHX8550427.1 hypothetical protein [Salmonella enterica]